MRGHVAATHRVAERLDVALLEVGDELRPRLEAGLAGDGELRVGELRAVASGSPASERTARMRASAAGVAVARGANQILGELVLLFEIGGNTGTSSAWTRTTSFNKRPCPHHGLKKGRCDYRKRTVTGGRRPSRGLEASC